RASPVSVVPQSESAGQVRAKDPRARAPAQREIDRLDENAGWPSVPRLADSVEDLVVASAISRVDIEPDARPRVRMRRGDDEVGARPSERASTMTTPVELRGGETVACARSTPQITHSGISQLQRARTISTGAENARAEPHAAGIGQ